MRWQRCGATNRPAAIPPGHSGPATSGLALPTGDRYPGWKGGAFVGALEAPPLVRLELAGREVTREERLLQEFGARSRDVRQRPDGWLYVVTDSTNGRIARLER